MDKTGNLYAGGVFDSAGGAAVNHVATWDGVAWSALGRGINNLYDFDMGDKGVFALALDPAGNLYAAGDFDSAGGMSANFIARWDGSAWSALGSGFNLHAYCVNDIATDSAGNLYAGGNFVIAGGKVSAYIAKCKTGTTSLAPLSRDAAGPPLHQLDFEPISGVVRVNLEAATTLVYRLFDLNGRMVFGSSEYMAKGKNTLTLSTIHRIPGGVYIAQVIAGSESLRFKMVVKR